MPASWRLPISLSPKPSRPLAAISIFASLLRTCSACAASRAWASSWRSWLLMPVRSPASIARCLECSWFSTASSLPCVAWMVCLRLRPVSAISLAAFTSSSERRVATPSSTSAATRACRASSRCVLACFAARASGPRRYSTARSASHSTTPTAPNPAAATGVTTASAPISTAPTTKATSSSVADQTTGPRWVKCLSGTGSASGTWSTIHAGSPEIVGWWNAERVDSESTGIGLSSGSRFGGIPTRACTWPTSARTSGATWLSRIENRLDPSGSVKSSSVSSRYSPPSSRSWPHSAGSAATATSDR